MNVAEALQFVKDNYEELEMIINDEYLYEGSFYDDIEDNGMDCFAICAGASKGVIIPFDKSDYVIKIPFNYDDYSDEYYCYNYCDLEYENYKRAIECGVADFFAEIKPLIDINGHTIYVQARVIQGLWNSNKKYQFEEAKKKVNDIYGGNVESDCPTCTIALLIDNYGELKVLDFLIFISEYDINDLTDNNIGMLDGKIKILDYSGFFPM